MSMLLIQGLVGLGLGLGLKKEKLVWMGLVSGRCYSYTAVGDLHMA